MRCRTLALGLGSNLKNPVVNLRRALHKIKKISELKILNVSSIYESEAQVPEHARANLSNQYLNAVVLCEVSADCSPVQLLQAVKQIEKSMGREATERWAPRVIDIDLLFWDGPDYKDEILQIPHLHLQTRPFALLPLLEVWPQAHIINRPDWVQAWISEKPFKTVKSKTAVWPEMVGILNITDDSFSDGGQFVSRDVIMKQALHLLESGADVLDVGAESTRPGASAISLEKESQRLLMAVSEMTELKSAHNFKISLDSRNSGALEAVLEKYSVDFLNDVSGFNDPRMIRLLKESKLPAFVMHSLSIPPNSELTLDLNLNPCLQLSQWWLQKLIKLDEAGVSTDQLIFDPGIGFGKTKLQNMFILNHLAEFNSIHQPIMIGHSRKSFQTFFSARPAHQRDLETALVTKNLNLAFTQYLRVHNIETQKIALRSVL